MNLVSSLLGSSEVPPCWLDSVHTYTHLPLSLPPPPPHTYLMFPSSPSHPLTTHPSHLRHAPFPSTPSLPVHFQVIQHQCCGAPRRWTPQTVQASQWPPHLPPKQVKVRPDSAAASQRHAHSSSQADHWKVRFSVSPLQYTTGSYSFVGM